MTSLPMPKVLHVTCCRARRTGEKTGLGCLPFSAPLLFCDLGSSPNLSEFVFHL